MGKHWGGGRNDIIIGVLWPPNQPKEVDGLFANQLCKNYTTVVMENFIYPDINLKPNSAANGGMSLADKLIIQKIEETTKGSDILDLILTNRDKMVKGVEVVGTLEESDHIIQEFTIMQAQLTKDRPVF